MANTNIEFLQAELDRLTSQIANFSLSPDVSTNGKIITTTDQKITQLANLRTEAVFTNSQIQAQKAANILNSNSVQSGQYPFIYGVRSMYNIEARTYTTELGYPYAQVWAEILLALVVGISKTPASNYLTAIPDVQTSFEIAPSYTYNVQSTRFDPSISSGTYMQYSDSTFYSYSPKPFILFTLRNNNLTTNKTVQLNFNFSAYTTYAGAGINMFTPNNTNSNKASISSYTFSNLYSYVSNTSNSNSGNQNITIPADKTVIIQVFSSDRYYTTGTLMRNLWINNPRALFTSDVDVVCDYAVMENMRRSMMGDTVVSNLVDLWKLTPPTNRLSQVGSNLDALNLMDKTIPVYASNAAAIAGGLSVGNVYSNATGALSLVI